MNTEERKQIIEYYKNLLIIQYHNKPKAKAVIETLVSEILNVVDFAIQIRDCFNIETAVGAQLDIIAKYFGVSRYYPDIIFNKEYYNFQYTEGSGVKPPEAEAPYPPEGHPFQTVQKKGEGLYKTLRDRKRNPYTMTDSELRSLIKLRIICFKEEKLTYSYWYEIFFNFFNLEIIPVINSNMTVDYYIDSTTSHLYDIVSVHTEILPAPAGVGVNLHGTLPEDVKEMALKVMQVNKGQRYNRFQAPLQTLSYPVSGKLKVLEENE